MNVWIIADTVRLAVRVRESLQTLAIDCPSSQIVPIDSIGSHEEVLSQFDGIVLLATSHLEQEHLAVLQKLRKTTPENVTIIVVSSIDNHGTVLNAIRSGASDFVTADDNLNEELLNSINRLKSQLKQKKVHGRVISIVPCQAAGDASCLSANLASVIARRGRTCGLLDFQMRAGDLAMLLQLSPRHTVVDLLKQQGTIDEAIFGQALTLHESGIRLLAGPDSFIDLRSIRPQACQQIISLAKHMHEFVIINSEDLQHAEQIRALADSNDIVLTMRLDVVSLHRAKQHLELMTQNRIPRDNIHIVAFGAGHSTELPTNTVTKVLQIKDIHCIPDDAVSMLRSVNVGNPIVDESPNTKISHAIVAIADSLIGQIESTPTASALPRRSKMKSAISVAMNSLSFVK